MEGITTTFVPTHEHFLRFNTLFLFAFLLCVLALSIILFRISGSKFKLPPGPRGLPFIGHLHLLGTNPHSSLCDLSKIHGPLMHLRFGSIPVVVASTPLMARQILQVQDANFSFRFQPAVITQVYSSAHHISFTNPGPVWKLMRQICVTDLFCTKRFESFRPLITEEVHALLLSILDSGDKVLVRAKMYNTTNNIVARMTVGKRLADLATRSQAEDSSYNMVNLLVEFVQLLGVVNVGDFMPYLAWMDLQGCVRKIKPIALKLSTVWQEVIDARREMHHQGKNNASKERDFLDMLLAASNQNKSDVPVSDATIIAVLTDMFVGAVDTSSLFTEWALAELLANPIAMKNLQDELVRIVGMSRLVHESDLPSLPYLHAVVKETMRLHPVAPFLVPHKASQECKIFDFDIPEGTLAYVNVWAIGRDPNVWERPLEFKPERFLECNMDVHGQHFELLPFGSGRRACPGLKLGLTNFQHMLASIVHSFDWSTTEKLNMSEKFGVLMALKNPLIATAKPRLARHLFE